MATATSSRQLTEKLIDYLQDVHAMETEVKMLLRTLITTTADDELRRRFEQHSEQTDRQLERIEQCLSAHDRPISARKETQTIFAAIGKGLVDAIRGDKAGKNLRDAYITEHMEIASYQLLERLAERAGDQNTVDMARRNLAEEREMAEFVDARWGRAVDLTLEENGIR